jgi:hypothetical protein
MMDRNEEHLDVGDPVVVHGKGRLRAGRVVSIGRSYVKVAVEAPTPYERTYPPAEVVRAHMPRAVANMVNDHSKLADSYSRRRLLAAPDVTLDRAAAFVKLTDPDRGPELVMEWDAENRELKP